MADALDSKSSMGNHVWVQLPPPVLPKALSEKNFRRRLFCLMTLQVFATDRFSQNFTRSVPNGWRVAAGMDQPLPVWPSWASRFAISLAVTQSLVSMATRNWLSTSDRALRMQPYRAATAGDRLAWIRQ